LEIAIWLAKGKQKRFGISSVSDLFECLGEARVFFEFGIRNRTHHDVVCSQDNRQRGPLKTDLNSQLSREKKVCVFFEKTRAFALFE